MFNYAKTQVELFKNCEQLHYGVEDVANRDRCQNLKGNKPAECVRTIMSEALGIELDRFQLQRVHRAPTMPPIDVEGLPPRPIIIRLFELLGKGESVDGCKAEI